MNLTADLHTHRLIAIVRGPDADAALNTVLALADSGVALVEVSLTTGDAYQVLSRARAALGPEYALGAGTVLTAAQARAAADAGAAYLVTPGLTPAIGMAADLGLPVLAGALTPTEAIRAVTEGAAAVKLFPASLGGPPYLRALCDPLPHIAWVPVGGITELTAGDYLAAGATAVGVGSPLVGDAVLGGDLTAVRDRATRFLAAVAQH